jgi:hypothetical protein
MLAKAFSGAEKENRARMCPGWPGVTYDGLSILVAANFLGRDGRKLGLPFVQVGVDFRNEDPIAVLLDCPCRALALLMWVDFPVCGSSNGAGGGKRDVRAVESVSHWGG